MAKFIATYPLINPEWLVTGNGPMIKTKCVLEETHVCDGSISDCKDINNINNTQEITERICEEIPNPSINYDRTGAPYYNVDFIGGFDAVLNDQTATPAYFIDFAPFNKPGVVWCNITGHSMEPELNNGDIIAMREVSSPIEYLPAGEIYGIVTDDYRTVKRLRMSQRQGFVRLIPTNKSPEYAEQEIPITMIRKVFAVLGSVHRLF